MNALHYFELGGPMMWPLLACSVALVAVVLERLWVVGLGRGVFRMNLQSSTRGWHRRVLPFFKDVPPSLGLLGTVVGVVQSFNLTGGRVDADAVGAGLAVACMTTVFGLSIAIVASAASYLFDALAGVSDEMKHVTVAGGEGVGS